MPAPTLIVIDVQRALDDPRYGERNNPGAERSIARVIEAWRDRGAPLIHVRHESEALFAAGTETVEFKPEALPRGDEPVVTKHVNTTDHCVSTTVRMAGDLGFETWVLEDATATHPRRARDGELIPGSPRCSGRTRRSLERSPASAA